MNEKENPMQKIIARCWEDEEFKKKLMANPNAVLKAEGVTVPDGITVNVVEDTEQARTMVIPARPHDLDDNALGSVAAGMLSVSGCFHTRDASGSGDGTIVLA